MMTARQVRAAPLAAGAAIVFLAAVAILLQIVPGPHRPVDLMVIGGVATLVTMLVLFVVLTTSVMRLPGVFYRRDKPE